MLESLRTYGLVLAVVLIALVASPILPAVQDARSEPRPAETTPAAIEEAPKQTAAVNGETTESAYEKLALNKLTIEREAPEKPELTPEPERKPQKKEPKRRVQAGVTSMDVLPGPARKAPRRKPPVQTSPEQGRAERKPVERKATVEKAQKSSNVSKARTPIDDESRRPRDTRLLLSIPRLGIENVTVGHSPDQSYLDREGIMHLSETGFPYEPGSNTYIVGHAAD